MLGHQAAGLRQSLPDGRHSQRSTGHHTQRCARQRLDTFGVQITPIKLADEATNLGQTLTRTRRLDHETYPSATAFRFYGAGANRSYS